MSTCSSDAGEYSEHEAGDWCARCDAFNEDAVLAQRDALRAEVEGLRLDLEVVRADRDKAVRDWRAASVKRLRLDLEEARADRDRRAATVNPSRETVAREVGYHVRTAIALHRAYPDDADARTSAVEAQIGVATNALLSLLPGRAEAEVKAEAWNEAVLAFVWANMGGSSPLDYVLQNNPYRKETSHD